MPCPTINCKGTNMSITLGEGKTYSLSVQDKGREDKPRIFEGTFFIKDTVITLDAEGDHLKFRVYDDSLKKLDKFGNPEQYGPPEGYILKKN
ncbi:copper resistance protein NlpE N-terminal domain-containing protein [Flavobacterium rhizosphaerae]|uniref:Copper resistance protein NlpE N-terminal domain-containing protein n=1 Tax=Flavobacterium rhizosphaerae TaxID=3163298 RepID=A0ABW8YYU1_9FLAO